MDLRITPADLKGRVAVTPSKSDAHRILISAALANQPTLVRLSSYSKDIHVTMNCLRSLGAKIDADSPDLLHITPLWPNRVGAADLDCGESGSTFRFLLPLAAALGVTATFTGHGRLPERPIQQLIDQLQSHGCQFDQTKLPFTVRGKITGGHYTLPGDVSSQFISGLLFALPLLAKDSLIVLTSQLESKGYAKMTMSTLKKFGVEIEELAAGYHIKGRQKYLSPQQLRVEGDWSNAAFWICAGALQGSDILCSGLNQASVQGDKEIINLLKGFAANVSLLKDTAHSIGKTLQGQCIDAAEIPDLIPIISVVAAAAQGTTEIYNAKRLRIKESDRLAAMAENLARLGADVTEKEDGLIIRGGKPLRGGSVNGFGDHRIVMSMAIAAKLCQRELIIAGAEAVEKSYPQFFDHYKMLGGIVDVI
ncbi:3-phosphoshikimate 1-carboxyvinyltransferase [Desulfotomaculum sp. 1211_IL3151]|uniref:3-phosphoshikimate 1-carboxyvinyltransferase n=1 Tax=Desulfotomaculum sp. 1211_IL3151 TaxID=3084055 RepID=UPI002FDB464C